MRVQDTMKRTEEKIIRRYERKIERHSMEILNGKGGDEKDNKETFQAKSNKLCLKILYAN